jgi:1-phosphatidylinositol phosphodiesterase
MTSVDSTSWMSGVEDATPINQMSIPGSHESCSRFGGSSTECQDLDASRT